MNAVVIPHKASPLSGAAGDVRRILFAATVATMLDLAVAVLYWELRDVSAQRVLQSIAAYWGWGRAAYSGGAALALVGAGMFFARMIVLALIYRIIARRHAMWVERPYLCGAAFGLAVYLINRYLVIPSIGAMPVTGVPSHASWVACCIVAHIVCIGMVLALFERHRWKVDRSD